MMSELKELTVKVSNEENSYTKKRLEYSDLNLSSTDPILSSFVNEAVKEFNGDCDDIVLKIKMIWK